MIQDVGTVYTFYSDCQEIIYKIQRRSPQEAVLVSTLASNDLTTVGHVIIVQSESLC